MVTNTLHAAALPDDFANRIGRLIEARATWSRHCSIPHRCPIS